MDLLPLCTSMCGTMRGLRDVRAEDVPAEKGNALAQGHRADGATIAHLTR
jgi:hypothetical protein